MWYLRNMCYANSKKPQKIPKCPLIQNYLKILMIQWNQKNRLCLMILLIRSILKIHSIPMLLSFLKNHLLLMCLMNHSIQLLRIVQKILNFLLYPMIRSFQ